MKNPLCLCGHVLSEHDTTRADKRCTVPMPAAPVPLPCPCSGFARSAYQPGELRADGHRLKKRGQRYGDKPGNLVERIGAQR